MPRTCSQAVTWVSLKGAVHLGLAKDPGGVSEVFNLCQAQQERHPEAMHPGSWAPDAKTMRISSLGRWSVPSGSSGLRSPLPNYLTCTGISLPRDPSSTGIQGTDMLHACTYHGAGEEEAQVLYQIL